VTDKSAAPVLAKDRMAENAFVCWMVCEEPWDVERAVIGTVPLPLNLDQNSKHPFAPVLRRCRAAAREQARELPVVT
jgi:hypothetical protein